MDIYIKIDGGIGRVISATGVVEKFAKLKEEEGRCVNVVSSFPQLFNGLDHINRCYNIGMPYLYEDYISKGEFLEPEPYNNHLYYKDNEHISNVFNYLLNGEREFVQPKIVLTDNEQAEAKQAVQVLREQFSKKIMLIQPWGSQGGIPMKNGEVMADESYRSFSLKFFEELVSYAKNDYHILSVQSKVQHGDGEVSQHIVQDTMPTMNPDVRRVVAVIPYVDVVVTCDSFLHHAVAALNNPVKTIVLWGGTNDKNLGYDGQINIRTNKKVLFEPNRVPHDRSLYVSKNKGCNDFNLDEIKIHIEEDKKCQK